MTISLTKPTVDGDNGDWGGILNTALDQLNGYDRFAYKTADETVSASTTVQDDDHLTGIALDVGTYIVEARYLVSGTAAGDVKIGWVFSGTASGGYRAGIGPSSANTTVLGVSSAQGIRAAAAADTATTYTTVASYGVDGTNIGVIFETGLLVVTVAGDLKVQWAQLAASGSTVMRAGSWLLAHRVA